MIAEQPEKLCMRAAGLFITLTASMFLTACSSDMSDLEQYKAEVLARPGGRIEPLPQIKPYETYSYFPGNKRSPFSPDVATGAGPDGPCVGDCLRPDDNRKREFLEDLPLDSLRMVGTMQVNNELLGLVQDPDGLIHQVRVGNYAGQNHGRIVALGDSEIKIVEIISDGLGGWIERPAAIALSD